MDKSEFLELNLPSRDNATDIADINAISDNFRTIDSAFLNLVEDVIPELQTKENINLNFDDDSTNEEQYPSVPAVVNFTNRKVDPLKIVNSASGNVIALKDSANDKLVNLKLYGKTTQNGTPTPDAPVSLVSVGDSGSFTVKIQGENVEEQTFTNNDTLRSVAEYKDEKDFVKGMTTQKIGVVDLGTLAWESGGNGLFYTHSLRGLGTGVTSASEISKTLCTHYKADSQNNVAYTTSYDKTHSMVDNGFLRLRDNSYTDATSLKTALSGVMLYYPLWTPIETPLSESELNAYSQLHTNKPNTTFISEADMEVSYVADTKLYIDNKIAELTALTLEV